MAGRPPQQALRRAKKASARMHGAYMALWRIHRLALIMVIGINNNTLSKGLAFPLPPWL
jgi:hypothetical protein